MCLITSHLQPFTASKDFKAYKVILKIDNGDGTYSYKSPFRYSNIDFQDNSSVTVEIPQSSKRTYSTYNYGSKLSVGSGFLHGLLNTEEYSNYNPGKHTIIEVKIPQGANYYISDDLTEICADKMIYTTTEVDDATNAKVDSNTLKEIVQPLIDEVDNKQIPSVNYAYGEDVTITSENNDVTLKITNTDKTINTFSLLTSQINEETYKWIEANSNAEADLGKLLSRQEGQAQAVIKPVTAYVKAKTYLNGFEDCDAIKDSDINIKNFPALDFAMTTQNGYLPSIGELTTTLKYQLYINAKLANAGSDKRVKNHIYWSSTFYNNSTIYTFNTSYFSMNTHHKSVQNYVLPFKRI